MEEAGKRLRKGEVGLVPTDTVVGLLAGETGVLQLSGIKGRDPNKPIALLCSSAEEAFALARETPPLARLLAERGVTLTDIGIGRPSLEDVFISFTGRTLR